VLPGSLPCGARTFLRRLAPPAITRHAPTKDIIALISLVVIIFWITKFADPVRSYQRISLINVEAQIVANRNFLEKFKTGGFKC
jgi:hypothetical protein